MDNVEVVKPKVASVKLRVKHFKNPKLEVFHNPLEDRVYAMGVINSVIDRYEELSGYQWNGCNYAFIIWDHENTANAVIAYETTGLDHPEMIGDYLKALVSTGTRVDIL